MVEGPLGTTARLELFRNQSLARTVGTYFPILAAFAFAGWAVLERIVHSRFVDFTATLPAIGPGTLLIDLGFTPREHSTHGTHGQRIGSHGRILASRPEVLN